MLLSYFPKGHPVQQTWWEFNDPFLIVLLSLIFYRYLCEDSDGDMSPFPSGSFKVKDRRSSTPQHQNDPAAIINTVPNILVPNEFEVDS